jgi:hypothetical protein
MADAIKVTVDPVELEVVSEPYVHMTFRGYAPVVDVSVAGATHMLYISSKSISVALEPLVEENGEKFSGLKLRVKKESEEKMAPYVVEKLG